MAALGTRETSLTAACSAATALAMSLSVCTAVTAILLVQHKDCSWYVTGAGANSTGPQNIYSALLIAKLNNAAFYKQNHA